jgi:hypothetical protein
LGIFGGNATRRSTGFSGGDAWGREKLTGKHASSLSQQSEFGLRLYCATSVKAGRDMKKALAAMMLLALTPAAQARPIDWQAELDRCRALREQMAPLLLAGQSLSPIARSGTSARRCVWMERRARKRGAH